MRSIIPEDNIPVFPWDLDEQHTILAGDFPAKLAMLDYPRAKVVVFGIVFGMSWMLFLLPISFPVSYPISHVLWQNPCCTITYYHKSLLLSKITWTHQNTTKCWQYNQYDHLVILNSYYHHLPSILLSVATRQRLLQSGLHRLATDLNEVERTLLRPQP